MWVPNLPLKPVSNFLASGKVAELLVVCAGLAWCSSPSNRRMVPYGDCRVD